MGKSTTIRFDDKVADAIAWIQNRYLGISASKAVSIAVMGYALANGYQVRVKAAEAEKKEQHAND